MLQLWITVMNTCDHSYYMVLTAVGWWRCAWWGWTWWCLARLRNLRRRRLVLQNTSWEKNGCNCDGTKSESPVGSQRCFQDFSCVRLTKLLRITAWNPKKWQRWNPHLLHPGATNLPDHSLELCDLVIAIPCKSISRICKCIYIYIHKRNTRCAWHQWNGVPESRRRRLVNASRAQLCSLPPGEANEMDGKTTQNSSINLHINRDYCTMKWTHLAFKSLTNVPARICSDSWSSRTEIFISLMVGVARPNFENHLWRLS